MAGLCRILGEGLAQFRDDLISLGDQDASSLFDFSEVGRKIVFEILDADRFDDFHGFKVATGSYFVKTRSLF